MPRVILECDLRYHAGLNERLDSRLRGPFVQLLLEVHATFPNPGELPHARSLATLWGVPIGQARRMLASMVAAGLAHTCEDGILRLASEFRNISVERSNERVARLRSVVKMTQKPKSVVKMTRSQTDTEHAHALRINDLAEKCNARGEDRRSNLSSLDTSKSKSLIEACGFGGNPPPTAVDPDDFDAQLESIERSVESSARSGGEFRLTPPGNGNGADPAGARAVFDAWNNSPGCIRHRQLGPYVPAISHALRIYGLSNTLLAISRYSEVRSNKELWSYGWTLRELITRHSGKWIDTLLSDDYIQRFAKRRDNALGDHFSRLLADAAGRED